MCSDAIFLQPVTVVHHACIHMGRCYRQKRVQGAGRIDDNQTERISLESGAKMADQPASQQSPRSSVSWVGEASHTVACRDRDVRLSHKGQVDERMLDENSAVAGSAPDASSDMISQRAAACRSRDNRATRKRKAGNSGLWFGALIGTGVMALAAAVFLARVPLTHVLSAYGVRGSAVSRIGTAQTSDEVSMARRQFTPGQAAAAGVAVVAQRPLRVPANDTAPSPAGALQSTFAVIPPNRGSVGSRSELEANLTPRRPLGIIKTMKSKQTRDARIDYPPGALFAKSN